ncbi:MAG: DUF6057 family protein [Bacteroidales bacterium]|nr:DUF6057 family protein [Bacteroidales bacterium]
MNHWGVKTLFSALLGLAAMLFWVILHPEWLSFHEQYQMFMFTGDYVAERLVVAGGLADYLAEFCVQFFFYKWAGGLVMALLLVAIQLCVWLIARRIGANENHYPLSLIPSLLIVAYLGDHNAMPTFVMTILMALALALGYTRIVRYRCYCQIALIPLAYWTTGYGMFVYLGLTAIYDMLTADDKRRTSLFLLVYFALAALTLVVSTYTFMLRYTMHDILLGVNTYRQRLVTPGLQHAIAALVVFMPLAMMLVSRLRARWLLVVESVAAVVMGYWATTQYPKRIYDLFKYDYFVRNERWNAVINYARREGVNDAMACTAVNLALGMKGQLLDNMGEFNQCGQQGLLTRFDRNMVSCTITAEACYHLGLINSAMRYNYDLQESVDNRRKSCRFSMRIAEGYLVNGRYDASMKYLKRLSHTLFYSSWAKDAMTYLYDEAKINAHPVWGKLRRYQFEEDELYSVSDLDRLLCRLFEHCPENSMALDYGLACTLLNNDLKHFEEFYPLSKLRKSPYNFNGIE